MKNLIVALSFALAVGANFALDAVGKTSGKGAK